VLVDQDKCRGWRMCISGWPDKKIYFNWKVRQGREVHLLLPRIEAASHRVLGILRRAASAYLGVILYDADRIEEAASVVDEKGTLRSAAEDFPRPTTRRSSLPHRAEGIRSLARICSEVAGLQMAIDWKIAFPLHPEYRTLPMCVRAPLSPIQAAAESGKMGMNGIIPDTQSLRIPITYLANLLTGGKEKPVITRLTACWRCVPTCAASRWRAFPIPPRSTRWD